MSDLVARARAALDGVTPGEWSLEFDPSKEGFDCLRVSVSDVCVIGGCGCCGSPFGDNAQDARFIAAARSLVPDMADRIEALEAEVARLRYGLECVYQYGSDTLVGPSQGVLDDREWQREGVLVMTSRARATLGGASEQDIVSIRAPFASPPTPETSHD